MTSDPGATPKTKDEVRPQARLELARTVATRLVAGWPASPPAPTGERAAWRVAQRALLGPLALSRALRRLGGRAPGAGWAESGVRVAAAGAALPAAALDVGAPIEAACRALGAIVAGEPTLTIGPGVDRAWLEEALAPALALGLAAPEVAEDLPAARATVVIAPFYYAPSDLDRLAWQLVLEALDPSPSSEAALHVLLARGWDQREQLERAVTAQLGERAAAVDFEQLDTDRCEDTLVAAREPIAARPPSALAVFVYPMHRERPEVEAALRALLDKVELTTINARPTAAWAAGVGGRSGARCVEHAQLLHPVPSAAALRLGGAYEAAPSWGTALKLAASSWARAILA